MIISFLQTKGGTAKTTLAKCIAYSKTFGKTFNTIGLVELDPQGTILAWHAQRPQAAKEKVGVAPLYDRDEQAMADTLERLLNRFDALILDVPGESVGKFATRFAAALSDVVLIPMRSSTNDEQSFIDHIFPIIDQTLASDPVKTGRFHIIPTFVHPQTRPATIQAYFQAVMPPEIGCLEAFLPYRSVYENFSREGRNLQEYARSVTGNARLSTQAERAVTDIEAIAKAVLKIIS